MLEAIIMEPSFLTFMRNSSEAWGEGCAANAAIFAATPTSAALAVGLLLLLELLNKETWSPVLGASRILSVLLEKKVVLRSVLEEVNG
jgi:hypothetical protein